MEQRTSRLESDILDWEQIEQRYRKLFGEKITGTKKLLQEKLAHFEVMELKYSGTQNRWEQMDLRLVKDERRKIERQLYPNFLMRLLYRTAKRILDNPAISRYQHSSFKNIQELKASLIRKGFDSVVKQLDQQLAKGQNEFSIPVSYQVSENERMDFQLKFSREKTGNYLVDDIKAILAKENDPSFKGAITMVKNDLDGITAQQACNLLRGRSVEHEGNWLALDFNDKDAAGNFRTKLYPPAYGFDLENALKQLPGSDQIPIIEIRDIMQNLKNGDRQFIELSGNRTEMQVDVQKKVIAPTVRINVRKQPQANNVVAFEQKKQQNEKKGMKLP